MANNKEKVSIIDRPKKHVTQKKQKSTFEKITTVAVWLMVISMLTGTILSAVTYFF